MTTRELLGLLVLDGALLAAGTALLAGLGLVRSARDGVRLAGLALLTGWAAVGTIGAVLLVLGASFAGWQLLAAAGLCVAGGLFASGRVAAVAELRRPATTVTHWLAAGAIGVLALTVVASLRRALDATAPTAYDAWAFWLPKARSIVAFDGIDTGAGGFTSFAHPAYPPLAPAMDAAAFRFMDTLDATSLAPQHWLLATAFLLGLAGLLAPLVQPGVLWPGVALLALLPAFRSMIGTSLGDEPLYLLVALAAVLAGLWVRERETAYAALAALLLCAAALAKAEGLFLAGLLGLVLVGVGLVRRPRAWRAPLVVVAAPLAGSLVWRAWLAAHEIPGFEDYRPSDLLRPGYLADRLDRLGTAVAELPAHLLEPDRWFLAVPLALAAAAVAAAREPALGALVLVGVPLGFLGIATIYWISPLPLHWYIDTSADRVVGSLAMICAALLPLLLAAALEPRRAGGT